VFRLLAALPAQSGGGSADRTYSMLTDQEPNGVHARARYAMTDPGEAGQPRRRDCSVATDRSGGPDSSRPESAMANWRGVRYSR